MPDLADLLRPDRPLHLELHHLLGHDHAILGLARALGVPVDAYVHDYALFCPRIALVGREGRYCGEPDTRQCVECVADAGSNLEETIGPAELVARSTADLADCRRVVVPSRDTATRVRRHFPGVRPAVRPWEDDGQWPNLAPAAPQRARRVCVIGAIGIEKGYDVLLGCVRDAAYRALPVEFVVCGFTVDDERLLGAGPVFVTGRYEETEAIALIRAQRAQVAFLPSVFPETWCFALSRAWQAGLPAVAFELGAQAERIRATGRGWLLSPRLAPAAINDALLRLPPLPPRSPKTVDQGTACQTLPSLLPR